jgi:hypothetical protein
MKNIEIKNIPEVPSKIKRAVNDKKLAIFIQSKTRDELINVRINEVYKTPTVSSNNLKFIISNKPN